ncbi:MAG: endonuclease/exonuclease/phosphatase family protein [Betaproteobacteria bacterium]|nr:endonuclease/exonuclease/phosphatase family protein [Betaproteobacteria bacterium]
MTSIRVATWNLKRPKRNGWQRNANIQAKLREINADIWVLTETNAVIIPTSNQYPEAGYVSVASLPSKDHQLGESFSTIWSRWGITRTIPTFDSEMAVCAETITPLGPMIVYGTIITYANDKGPRGTSTRWKEHQKAIKAQGTDWLELRTQFPDHLLCVAGDFNQNLDGTDWYSEAESDQLLARALEAASLRCVTSQDMRKDFNLSRANIDHICISGAAETIVAPWEGESMSDHNGVAVIISDCQ